MTETTTIALANGSEVELVRDGFDVTATVYPGGATADFDLMFSYEEVESWAVANGATAEEAEDLYWELNDMDYRAQDGE